MEKSNKRSNSLMALLLAVIGVFAFTENALADVDPANMNTQCLGNSQTYTLKVYSNFTSTNRPIVHGFTEAEAFEDLAKILRGGASRVIRYKVGNTLTALPAFFRFCPTCPPENLSGCNADFINISGVFKLTPTNNPNDPNAYEVQMKDEGLTLKWHCELCGLDELLNSDGSADFKSNPAFTDPNASEKCGNGATNQATVRAGNLDYTIIENEPTKEEAIKEWIRRVERDNGVSFQALHTTNGDSPGPFGCPDCPGTNGEVCSMIIRNNSDLVIYAHKIQGTSNWKVGRTGGVKLTYFCSQCPDTTQGGNGGNGGQGSSHIMSVMPNPNSGIFTTEFELISTYPDVRIRLVDMNGNMVTENPEGTLMPGIHTSSFNLSGLVPGNYSIHLVTGGSLLNTYSIVIY